MLKNRLRIIIYALCVISMPLAWPAYGQTPQDQANQKNLEILRQYEQQRQQDDFQTTIEREKEAVKSDLRQEPADLPQQGACIDVREIILEGITLLELSVVSDIKKYYEGRCLYLSDINALAEEITNLYMEKGYISSRAYIPAQDLSSGQLTLVIVEGRLEEIEYRNGNKEGLSSEPQFAFPLRAGDFLNLRAIEQGLDQMNRLKSNNAKMTLSPGTKNGGSIVRIENEKSKLWHIETGVENTGSESTGEWQGFGNYEYDNFLGINDLATVGVKHDLERANRRQSRNFSFRYEIPYGYWNFSYALSYFHYISEVKTSLADYKTEGFSRSHDFLISRVLRRDQNSKTNVTLGLTAKEAENYFAGVRLDASSQNLTIVTAGVSHSLSIPQGFIYGGLNFSRGLSLIGAHEDNGGGANTPKGQFSRFTADLNAIKLFDLGLGTYNPRFDLRGRAQWSGETLFGSEQISVGGPYSVRGFKESSISGEVGAYARLDVSIPIEIPEKVAIRKPVGILRPYVGFDVGAIKGDTKNPNEGGTLRSWSLGLKNEGGQFDFDLSYSRPVSSPAFVNEESHDLSFRASIQF